MTELVTRKRTRDDDVLLLGDSDKRLEFSAAAHANAYLLQRGLPADLRRSVESMVALCPTERGTVRLYGKVIEVPRFQESFLKPYFFSGQTHEPRRECPDIVMRLLQWINILALKYPNGDTFTANACLANWYLTGDHYIGAHADDESQLKQVAGNSFVACVTYGEARALRLRDRRTKEIVLDVVIPANSLYVMCGNFQKCLTHEFPKSKKVRGARVSFTFREFVEK